MLLINPQRLFLVIVGLFLISCQTSPISKKDDIDQLSSNIIVNLKRQAPKEISSPQSQEEQIIKNSINKLLLKKDKRFYPYISHLKENRIALMITDIDQALNDLTLKEDPDFTDELLFYKIVVSAFTDPYGALNELNLVNVNNKPREWNSLKNLINQRLNISENKLAILNMELINAKKDQNIQKQIAIHQELYSIEAKNKNLAKMIFHLQKVIDLSPNNDIEKLENYQNLINLYSQNKQNELIVHTARKALELAKLLGEHAIVAKIEAQIGFINIDKEIEEFAQNEFASIDNLERAMKTQSRDYLNFNNLFIIANKYKDLGDTRKAFNTILRGLRISRSLKNAYNEALAIKLIGDIARINGDLKQSYLHYSLANEIFKTESKNKEQLLTLSNIAVISTFNDDKDAAQRAFNEYLKVINSESTVKTDQELFMARYQAEYFIYNSWVNKSFDDTNQVWDNSISYLKSHPQQLFLEEVIGASAIVLNKMQQYKKAAEFYNTAIALAQKERKYFKEARYRTNLALTYNNLNDKDQTLINLQQAGIIFKSLRSPYANEVSQMINKISRL